MQQMIFIADLIACSTCFGHHYDHYQELENIIQNRQLENQSTKYDRQQPLI